VKEKALLRIKMVDYFIINLHLWPPYPGGGEKRRGGKEREAGWLAGREPGSKG
jgi:hypothetical protein